MGMKATIKATLVELGEIDAYTESGDQVTHSRAVLLTCETVADVRAFSPLLGEGVVELRIESGNPLTMFKLDGGATYWAAARSKAEAIGLCALVEPDAEEQWSGYTITEVSEKELEGATFYDDGTGTKRPMLDALREAKGPEVIACSEWP